MEHHQGTLVKYLYERNRQINLLDGTTAMDTNKSESMPFRPNIFLGGGGFRFVSTTYPHCFMWAIFLHHFRTHQNKPHDKVWLRVNTEQ